MRRIRFTTEKSYWQQDIKRREYAAAFVQGGALIITLSRLFYHSLLLGVLLLPLDFIYIRQWERRCMAKKKKQFQMQFKDTMQALAVALRTGYSIENAMSETLKDIKVIYAADTWIVQEFTQMNRQLRMNIPVEQIWQEFSDRSDQEDVRNFTAVFVIAKRSGGDTVSILRNAIVQISDKTEVKREIDTVMAQKRLEFGVMSMIPLGIISYMYLSFPEFMDVLYGNPAGIIIMTICLGAYGAAYWLGKKIIEIEV